MSGMLNSFAGSTKGCTRNLEGLETENGVCAQHTFDTTAV